MKKRIIMAIFGLVAIVGGTFLFQKGTALAFDANNIISVGVFENVGAMGPDEIDSFLNTFPSSCISPSSDFRTADPQGWSTSQNQYIFGANVTAGRAIYDTAQLYRVNPEVILATLQKEQSIVSGSTGCHPNTPDPATATPNNDGRCGSNTSTTCTTACLYSGGCMNIAMGYGCPNYCNAADEGFSLQLTLGAWLLRFGEERAYGILTGYTGYDQGDEFFCYGGPMTPGTRQRSASSSTCKGAPGNTPISYDGSYTTQDGVSLTITNGPTATLYNYTPFTSGNRNFDTIFRNWFGSPLITTPYAWAYAGQFAYSDTEGGKQFTSVPTVVPGGKIYIRVRAQNVGAQTWTPSTLHLGTSRPQDRVSVFADGSWLSNARPAALKESSVLSGDIGTFEFTMTAPSTPGTYNEYFNVLVEGREWLNDPGMFFTINVNNPLTTPPNSINTTLHPGDSDLHRDDYLLSPDAQSALTLQRNGDLALYSNFQLVWESGTQGQTPGRLTMQPDGNLVLYNTSVPNPWSSQTNDNSGAWLQLNTDGNMVIYNSGSSPIWHNDYLIHTPDHMSYINTTFAPGLGGIARMYPGQSIDTADRTDRKFHLILQRDGNLVFYSPTHALWSTGTDGKQTAFLAIQPDGNLVLYDRSGRALWASSTTRSGPTRLVIQQDGNLVIYNQQNVPQWNTGTAGAS